MSDLRTRFAPSPTGFLHIGGARTALYNWLWARQNGGTFVLRVEDTDTERSTEESVRAIFEAMQWLGLDWDEGPQEDGSVVGELGPYFQTQRQDVYWDFTEKLIASGHAYRCYSDKEELAAARAQHKEETGKETGFRFVSPWRDRNAPHEEGKPYVVRFKASSEGATAWDDKIKGRIEVQHNTLQDFVLMRSNGIPLYNLACAVDDLTMRITLVARGDDHMINTAPQILLHQALGNQPPEFAHLPLILAPSGGKLSKRHAAVSVSEYREMGYLPDAVLNYLVRLGWSHGDQEIFSRDELVKLFGWDAVGRTGAKYDGKKFEYVQAEHLRGLSDAELAKQVAPFLERNGLNVAADDAVLTAAIPYLKPRATTLVELAEGLDYFFREDFEFEEKGKRKFLVPDRADILRKLATLVSDIEPFEVDSLELRVKAWLDADGLKMKDVAQAARVALTGRTKSPGLFEVMALLGRERTMLRLEQAASLCELATET